jgi:two-component system response regulator TctD
MRILFVEDHLDFAKTVIREFLDGQEVEIAPTVHAARGLLSTRQFDVLLVDHDLPDGVGTEVVAHAIAIGVPVDIIAVSSHEAGNRALEQAGAGKRCPKGEFNEIMAVIARRT